MFVTPKEPRFNEKCKTNTHKECLAGCPLTPESRTTPSTSHHHQTVNIRVYFKSSSVTNFLPPPQGFIFPHVCPSPYILAGLSSFFVFLTKPPPPLPSFTGCDTKTRLVVVLRCYVRLGLTNCSWERVRMTRCQRVRRCVEASLSGPVGFAREKCLGMFSNTEFYREVLSLTSYVSYTSRKLTDKISEYDSCRLRLLLWLKTGFIQHLSNNSPMIYTAHNCDLEYCMHPKGRIYYTVNQPNFQII